MSEDSNQSPSITRAEQTRDETPFKDTSQKEFVHMAADTVAPWLRPSIKLFFKREGKGLKEGYHVVLIMLAACAWGTYQLSRPDPEEKHATESELNELRRENQNMKLIVAPLLARASKEFPGEEINLSLKKIIEKLSVSPYDQPITSIKVTVMLRVADKTGKPGMKLDGGCVWLGCLTDKGLAQLFSACTVTHISDGTGKISAVMDALSDEPCFKKPIRTLFDGNFIQIAFRKDSFPLQTKVMGGDVEILVNSIIPFRFEIPPQIFEQEIKVGEEPATAIFVTDLSKGFSVVKDKG